MTVRGNVQWLVATMEHLDDVGWGRGVDRWGRDELVHGLVVGGVARIVDKTGTTDIDGTGEESHTKGFLMGNALQCTNKISAFEVL